MTAIKHPKGLMSEAPYDFLNANKRARQKLHQTYVGDGQIFFIACKSQSVSSYKLFLVWMLYTFITLHSMFEYKVPTKKVTYNKFSWFF